MADVNNSRRGADGADPEAERKKAMKKDNHMNEEKAKDTEKRTAEADTMKEEKTEKEDGVRNGKAADQTKEKARQNEAGKSDSKEKQDEAKSAGSVENGDNAKGSGSGKKIKKDKKDEKIEELTDRLQRQMAEFDNFRKRTEREKSEMFDMGARDVIEKILPVVDNFERGLAGADESDSFVQGMNKIYKQMTKILTDMGVETIEAEGAEFDPNLHNAVMHEDNPDVGENIITQELQKGYKYKDVVVRHSMVKVAN